MQTPRLAATVQRSAFIHGYLHGYEEGFHEADFDLHMGHIQRGEYTREPKAKGYRGQFGSRHMFNAGFHEGFRVGYADGAAERSFRAFDNVANAMAAQDLLSDPPPGRSFDEGTRSGYMTGQQQGSDDARRHREAANAPACPVTSGRAQKGFCAAYDGGFRIGYSDGFVNQSKTVVAEAK